jgi:hypothetical protein
MSEFIPSKIGLIEYVETVETVDMGVQNLLFPKSKPQVLLENKFIQYDMREVKGRQRAFNSFHNSANITEGKGYSTVTLAPTNINLSRSLTVVEERLKRFGESQYDKRYGSAKSQIVGEIGSELHQDAIITTKFALYEALTTHKIKNGFEDETGFQDIVFAVPANNFEVLDNSEGNEYWDNTDAPILTHIKRAIDSTKATIMIMNEQTLGWFFANKQIVKVGANTDGNFYVNEKAKSIDIDSTTFYKVGRLSDVDTQINIDVYVETGTGEDINGDEKPYMPDTYVAYARKGAGSTEYGGIPTVSKNGFKWFMKEFDIDTDIQKNPLKFDLIYRSAPLPVLKDGGKFYTQKVKS